MTRITKALTVAALCAIPTLSTQAQGLKAVYPLEGYTCMGINLTHEQLLDNSVMVPVFNGPSASSGKAGVAAATIIVKYPMHVVNGFAEMLFFDGRTLWIRADKLIPFKSVSSPDARCTPSMLSNGKPGLG